MISGAAFITILGMLLLTQFCRFLGFLWLRRLDLSPRWHEVLQAAPACVLVALITPYFVRADAVMQLSACSAVLFSLRCGMLLTTFLSLLAHAGWRFLLHG